MPIADSIRKIVKEFNADNPAIAGKVYVSSGNRTVDQQIRIILNPRCKDEYPNIKKRFLNKFSLKKLPPYDEVAAEKDQITWWEKEVKKQAGKSPGFPHVGGNAVDIVVGAINDDDKLKLKKKIDAAKFRILYERVVKESSKYDVPLSACNVFHVYK